MALLDAAAVVITDSGGVQEETTYLGIPCLTIRPNTERPITIRLGTNRLVDGNADAIFRAVTDQLKPGTHRNIDSTRPELWDGCAAQRIAQVMKGQA